MSDFFLSVTPTTTTSAKKMAATGNRVSFEGTIDRVLFPKDVEEHLVGAFAIVKFKVTKITNGANSSLVTDDVISLKGGMPRLEYKGAADKERRNNITYTVTADELKDDKWGMTYNVVSMQMKADLTTVEDQKSFLSVILTPTQIDNLYEQFANPLPLFETEDIAGLTGVKGIGEKTARKLIDRYKSVVNNANAYVQLSQYGLTSNAIAKLCAIYKSTDIAIARIEENPYVLIREVNGYGWKKADVIALNKGFTRNDPRRVKAYAEFYLMEQCEQNGHSWMNVNALLTAVQTECSPIEDAKLVGYVKEMLTEEVETHYYDTATEDDQKGAKIITYKGPLLIFDKDTNQIGLYRYYQTEKTIARNLYRLQTAESAIHFDKDRCTNILAQVEEEQGFEYTDEQKNAIWNIINNQVSILTGKAGCVDGETEFFTPNGWKKIKDFQWGDKVLQYNDDGTATFVEPELYHKEPCDEFWHMSSRLVDQCVSDDHDMYYINRGGKAFRQKASEFMPRLLAKKYDSEMSMPSGFVFNGTGIDLTDAQLEVMLAVICDGSFNKMRPSSNFCRFHIKKDRKKQKLREIFDKAGIEYRESISATEGYTDFYITAPWRQKVFSSEWYNCSQHQLQLICDNILFWDGHTLANGCRQFSTSVKENADFVQFAFAACNQRATIYSFDRRNQYHSKNSKYQYKSVEYRVNIAYSSTTPFPTPANKSTVIEKRRHPNEYKYCFTVPSHLWISRRCGKIAGISNCGKSSAVNAIVKILKDYGQEVKMCALSGRASSKLTEITGLYGSTIHKLLGYNPGQGGFIYNDKNRLNGTMFVLDEASMVGAELFADLVKAIPSGAKFLMVGDIAQLESIGMGNVLKDCMACGVISSNILTKIHRQAQKSGIITESLRISQGNLPFNRDAIIPGEIRGELQDLKYTVFADYNLSQQKIVNEYIDLYRNRKVPAKDIQIIVPMRTRGNLSCRCINEIIQKIVNNYSVMGNLEQPVTYSDSGFTWTVTYRVNDRIIVTKNDYNVETINGEKTSIFNGNIGYIKNIGTDFMVVDLLTQKDVVLHQKHYQNIGLAYCVTCHKCQGDSAPYVIFGLDMSAYALLSREMVYTAITRARRFCSVVTQNNAFVTAVKTSRVKLKQTWLTRMLQMAFIQNNPEFQMNEVSDGDE